MPDRIIHLVIYGQPPDVVIWVDVRQLDAAWKRGRFYLGPGGGPVDGIHERYARFGEWIAVNGERVWTPHGGPGRLGAFSFTDGRHRFAWLRDHGVAVLPVSLDRAARFIVAKRFGTRARVCRLSRCLLRGRKWIVRQWTRPPKRSGKGMDPAVAFNFAC